MSLLRTAGRAAVASSVHGRVQRRQQQRWNSAAAQPSVVHQVVQPVQAAPVASPAPVAPAAAPMDAGERVRLLKDLAELHAAGVLTDAEFSAQKAALLAG